MKNAVFNFSAATRESPLDIPGVVFLNDVVVIHQALEAIELLHYRARCDLSSEVISTWKGVLTQLMGAVIYSKQKDFGKDCSYWNQSSVAVVSSNATAAVTKLARMLDKAVRPLTQQSNASLDAEVTVELAERVRKLERELKFLSSTFPPKTPLSGWTTFVRNLPLDFAKERFPQLPWEKLQPLRGSYEGRQALPELYDRLFTNAAFPGSVVFMGLKQEEFVRLELRPSDIPEVANAQKLLRENPELAVDFDCSAFETKSYVVRVTDAAAARQYLSVTVIQKVIDLAKEVVTKVDAQAELKAKCLEKELIVSAAKAKHLMEVLSPDEMAILRRLLDKALSQPSSSNAMAPKPADKRSRAKKA